MLFKIQPDWFDTRCVLTKDWVSDGFWLIRMESVENAVLFSTPEIAAAFTGMPVVSNLGEVEKQVFTTPLDKEYRITPLVLMDNGKHCGFASDDELVFVQKKYVKRLHLETLRGASPKRPMMAHDGNVWVSPCRILRGPAGILKKITALSFNEEIVR
jgi:hypothetical protein